VAKGEDSYDCKYVEHYVAITATTCWVIASNCTPGLIKCGLLYMAGQNMACLCVIDMVNLSMQLQSLACECVW